MAAMGRLLTGGLVFLVVVSQPGLTEAKCSKAGENCLKTGCCSTPGTKCFQKNQNYSSCMPSCEPGIHQSDPEGMRTEWTCLELTYGCAPAYQPCEGAKNSNDNTIPCCQWGCVCNYTSKYFHQCVPPEGEHECTKDGPQINPFDKSAVEKAQEHNSGSGDEEEAPVNLDEGEDVAETKDCFKVGDVMMGPDCDEEKSEILTDSKGFAESRDVRRPQLALAAVAAAAMVAAVSFAMILRRRSLSTAYTRHELADMLAEEEEAS